MLRKKNFDSSVTNPICHETSPWFVPILFRFIQRRSTSYITNCLLLFPRVTMKHQDTLFSFLISWQGRDLLGWPSFFSNSQINSRLYLRIVIQSDCRNTCSIGKGATSVLSVLKLDFTLLLILCHGFQVDVHGSTNILQYRKRLVVLDDLYLANKECYSVHFLYFLVV